MKGYNRLLNQRALFFEDLRRNVLPMGMLMFFLVLSYSAGKVSGRKVGGDESKARTESMDRCMEFHSTRECEHLLKDHAH